MTFTFTAGNILLVGAVLLFVSILISKTGFRYGVPTLLVFLLVGMLFGVDGLGFQFDNYHTAQFIGMIALSVILFAGGMDTKFSSIKPILGAGIVLSTFGVLLTTIITGGFIYLLSFFFDSDVPITIGFAFLMAATMSSTDSASVFSILRSQKMSLRNNLQPMLELESGSNDPMAYMLTIVMIQILQSGTDASISVVSILLMFFVQIAVGMVMGYLLGKVCVWVINKVGLHNKALYPILMISFIFFVFSFTDLLKGNGYLAVYIAGIVVGNHKLVEKRSIDSFLNGLVWLVQIIMFLMLGLLVNPHDMMRSAVPAIIIGVFMILLGRPLSVYLCLLPFRKIGFKDKTFVSWVGLRGAAPIIFAIYPIISGIKGGELIFNVVFFITLLSLLIQGTTIPAIAKWLKLGEKSDIVPENFGVEIPEELNTILEQQIVENESLLMNYPLPSGTLVMIVKRNHKYIVPNGKLHLLKGDKLLLISEKQE